MNQLQSTIVTHLIEHFSKEASASPAEPAVTTPSGAGRADTPPQTDANVLVEDWSRLVSFQAKIHAPINVDWLKVLLTKEIGADASKRIRVLGSRHSCSDIIKSDLLLSVSKLPLKFALDSGKSVATVSANMRLRDVLRRLGDHKKSLSATGGTDEQTLAGLISTNTAPATTKVGMYEKLRSVTYVTLEQGQAVEKTVLKGEPTFNSMVCSLGALGVLTELEFDVIDEPFYRTKQEVVLLSDMLGPVDDPSKPVDDILKKLDETSKKFDFWRIDWFPKTNKGLTWTATKIDADDEMHDNDYEDDPGLQASAELLRKLITKMSPKLNPIFELIYLDMITKNRVTQAKGPLRTMLPVDRRAPFRVAMAEWSFSPADLRNVKVCCENYFKANGWPNMPIEIELTKTDEYTMSPANWSKQKLPYGYVVKFNFMYMSDKWADAELLAEIREHLKGLWEKLVADRIPFKAHWGKLNFMDYKFVQENYQLDVFEKLLEGKDAFLNPYLTERLRPR